MNFSIRAFILFNVFLASAFGSSAAAWAEDTEGFYVFPSAANWNFVSLNETFFTVIQSISLPSGKYIANGTAVLASTTPGFLLVDCRFMLNGHPIPILGDTSRGIIGGGSPTSLLTLPVTVGFTVGTPQSLDLACRGDFRVSSQPSPITAIRVKHLTEQRGIQPQP